MFEILIALQPHINRPNSSESFFEYNYLSFENTICTLRPALARVVASTTTGYRAPVFRSTLLYRQRCYLMNAKTRYYIIYLREHARARALKYVVNP